MMEVRIEEMKPTRVAYVRHSGPYEGVGEAWKRLMRWGWKRMVFRRAPIFGMCWDNPKTTAPDRIRYDACMVVDGKARVRGEVRLQEIAGGTFAVGLHEGAYAGLGRAYGELCEAVAGGEIDGGRWRLCESPSIERYLNDPRRTKPEKLRTEVWVRVERG